MDTFLSQPVEHNHAPNPKRIPVIELSNQIKVLATTSDELTSTIFHSALRTFSLSVTGQHSTRNSFDRLRNWSNQGGQGNDAKRYSQRLSLSLGLESLTELDEKKPQFDHTLCNIYDRVIADLPRSNNSVGGWHGAFANRVNITHPTIKKLTEEIRREQSKFEVDIAQLFQGHQPKPKEACYRKFDERIARIVRQYDSLQIPQYLKNIAANVSLVAI
ncbi:unnamed protein product [Rotaria socialis]|uniref:Uncharacterized protein n=1 Tax=Rotaria socialis TaxID=392032 RepID=A0A821D6G1_9BILA|nr:unnamed protein product [Rotaria socialis]